MVVGGWRILSRPVGSSWWQSSACSWASDVDDPSGDGGSINLDVVDLKSHRVRTVTTVAGYEAGGDSGTNEEGSSAGLSWQPIVGSAVQRASRGMSACALGLPQPVTGSQPCAAV